MKKDVFDNFLSYIFLFFVFAIGGYIWEVILKLVQTGNLVNTGSTLGPWLQIYGVGGLLIVLLFKRFKNRPIVVFLLSLIVCTTIEYIASWHSEVTRGIRWWDYSNYFLNINGRVCLEGAITFGLAGCLVIYFIEPWAMKLFKKIPKKVMIVILIILVSLFIADLIYSFFNPNVGEGITYTYT